ncbi:Curli production assembly/transport component CsgG [Candidatus Electrothrix marina]|uniref:Curli production assembly/transport component CsgG n=1 Tax=Candidatus Electrothrix marina TaxID=1859130 RepID=A0A444JE63_9BACT|nr:Curli production assembly/transport component CsgG [Candidatus Electrothrix marina]
MKHRPVFRFISISMIWLYSTALAQAGQVITQDERAWARQILTQEKALGKRKTQNSLVVLYFNNRSGREELTPLQKGLTVMLIRDLAEVKQVEVVERTKMQALLDEMELGTSGLMDAETAPEVGVLLRTGYVAGGDILQGTTAELEINASVFDVPLDKFTPLQPVVGSVNEIAKLEKKVLFSILAHMQITLSPKKKAELAHPLSTSTAALLALFAGIDYSDRGLYLRAAQMYKQALQEDPKLKMAKDALEELKGMGLVTAEELGEKKIKKQITAAATTAPPTATGSTAPKTDEGLSTGNIVAIGLGMAAVGGGLALALGGQSDDDSSPTPAADPDDTTPPTVAADPAENTTLNCTGGNILFSFSEAMTKSGGALLSNGGSIQQGWRGDRVYEVSWSSAEESICNNSSAITVTLSGFKDASDNPLAQPISFTYASDEQEPAVTSP